MSSPLAVIATDGKQFTVTEGEKILIRKRAEEQPGSKIVFDKVLFLKLEDKIEVGTPTLEGVIVEAAVVGELKTKTVVFKKKRRQGFQVKNGAKEYYLQVEVKKIKQQ